MVKFFCGFHPKKMYRILKSIIFFNLSYTSLCESKVGAQQRKLIFSAIICPFKPTERCKNGLQSRKGLRGADKGQIMDKSYFKTHIQADNDRPLYLIEGAEYNNAEMETKNTNTIIQRWKPKIPIQKYYRDGNQKYQCNNTEMETKNTNTIIQRWKPKVPIQ